MKVLLFLLVIGGLLPTTSTAGEFVTISNFKLWSTFFGADSIRVTNAGTIVNPGNTCSNPDSYLIASSLTPDAKNRVYSSLLSSLVSNKSVELWIDGCEQNRPAIKDVVVN